MAANRFGNSDKEWLTTQSLDQSIQSLTDRIKSTISTAEKKLVEVETQMKAIRSLGKVEGQSKANELGDFFSSRLDDIAKEMKKSSIGQLKNQKSILDNLKKIADESLGTSAQGKSVQDQYSVLSAKLSEELKTRQKLGSQIADFMKRQGVNRYSVAAALTSKAPLVGLGVKFLMERGQASKEAEKQKVNQSLLDSIAYRDLLSKQKESLRGGSSGGLGGGRSGSGGGRKRNRKYKDVKGKKFGSKPPASEEEEKKSTPERPDIIDAEYEDLGVNPPAKYVPKDWSPQYMGPRLLASPEMNAKEEYKRASEKARNTPINVNPIELNQGGTNEDFNWPPSNEPRLLNAGKFRNRNEKGHFAPGFKEGNYVPNQKGVSVPEPSIESVVKSVSDLKIVAVKISENMEQFHKEETTKTDEQSAMEEEKRIDEKEKQEELIKTLKLLSPGKDDTKPSLKDKLGETKSTKPGMGPADLLASKTILSTIAQAAIPFAEGFAAVAVPAMVIGLAAWAAVKFNKEHPIDPKTNRPKGYENGGFNGWQKKSEDATTGANAEKTVRYKESIKKGMPTLYAEALKDHGVKGIEQGWLETDNLWKNRMNNTFDDYSKANGGKGWFDSWMAKKHPDMLETPTVVTPGVTVGGESGKVAPVPSPKPETVNTPTPPMPGMAPNPTPSPKPETLSTTTGAVKPVAKMMEMPKELTLGKQATVDLISSTLAGQGMNETQIAATIGNVGKETGFTLKEENLNYVGKAKKGETQEAADKRNVERVRHIFGKKRTNMSDSDLLNLMKDPHKFTEHMYGGIMGNNKEGDAEKYKGRGYIQITGKDNYRAASQALYHDDRLLQNPELVNRPEVAAQVLSWWMKTRGNAMAKSMGIDVKTASQADVNLAYTSSIAGHALKRNDKGYLNELVGKVDTIADEYNHNGRLTQPVMSSSTPPQQGKTLMDTTKKTEDQKAIATNQNKKGNVVVAPTSTQVNNSSTLAMQSDPRNKDNTYRDTRYRNASSV